MEQRLKRVAPRPLHPKRVYDQVFDREQLKLTFLCTKLLDSSFDCLQSALHLAVKWLLKSEIAVSHHISIIVRALKCFPLCKFLLFQSLFLLGVC